MIILKEGKMHKHMAWFTTCEICNSELKILEGDPKSTPQVCYNCDASQYYIRYICPVCGQKRKAYTNSSFGVKGNAVYKEIILEKEDREEMASWKDCGEISMEDLEWITDRSRV